MKINSELLKEIEEYVSDLILRESSEFLNYHTVAHTRRVVQNAEIIGIQENLNEDEMNILLASAWFHDTGYIKKYQGHEQESVIIAENYLKLLKVDEDIREKISECIIATTFPQLPENKISEVLCDADLMHFGREDYFELAEKLRQEFNNAGVRKLKKVEFEQLSIQLLKDHTYFTSYCLADITKTKEKNIKLLQESLLKRQQKKKAALSKANRYSRGVDSMFKLTARNQINLSSIADNKSNILISLNGIIISLGLVAIASKFKEEPAIIMPTVVFIVFSMSTIILAILSTRPNISSGKFTKDDIKQKKVNMLFFGNFYNMELDEYEWAIREMINDDQYLYSTMTKDQYSLGKVLAKKYKLLRWAYNIFMLGIVVSVTAFLLVFLNM
ncbi:MAG: HD domain-containing protein [Bacteroidetes bacterium]|jgi:predicted metal-dependent HD superfamily phosphohydrolase|nr:HD domain-containing protein [Bacteroidota bacterium]MBT3749837.1 HD domain-containing protein [Bacteroidota bacterium]MBT4401110.1 HD domain-containing protein [Bacteroidota bacterium]MBT4410115.1 HD domain-containing protein [Bacteroidota bacterium]MBT7095633.1 HD domain-containing protein [Bacteroidota bacterium]